jgi:cell division protein FtsW (lipid II flippase)
VSWLLIEFVLLAVVAVLCWLGADQAVTHMLDKAAAVGAGWEVIRQPEAIRAAASSALLQFLGGVFLLGSARLYSVRRGHGNVSVPFLVPAVCAAAAIGFCLQMGYGNAVHRQFWGGPAFAEGWILAAALGALLLILPRDPADILAPLQWLLPVVMVAAFVLLLLFGTGTEMTEDTRINLGGFQPVEVVKLLFVVFLAQYFGTRASKLRHQRDKVFGLDFPRKSLLWPAILMMMVLFGALAIVRDLGPTLILSVVFLVLFYIATRAGGWILFSLVLVAGMVAAVVTQPEIANAPKVALRMRMWLDPWYNGLPFGDQTALARWAIAAGGWTGLGLGTAPATALPAGHTDLVQAHLAEELGAVGLIGYILLIAVIAGQGLWIAAFARTAERTLMAAGLATLLVTQWAVIFAGTTGLLPLTGVVAPYLSYGKSSIVVFVLLAAMLARLAESGAAREVTTELVEVRIGAMRALSAAAIVFVVGVATVILEAIVWGRETSARGVVTLLERQPGDPIDRIAHRHDPRLEAIARRIRRGHILDRNGETLVGTDADGKRVYPLGDALGTLLGPPEDIVLRPAWMLERLLDARLRGFPELPDGPAVWLGLKDEEERLLFVVRSRVPNAEDQARAEAAVGEGGSVRLLPLPAPDLRPIVPLLHGLPFMREKAIEELSADVGKRSVRTTLDARLQQAAVAALKTAALKGKAAAAVVIDVDTGQVLARAQVPDFNPGDPKVLEKLKGGEFTKDKKFAGIYGPWLDKTGQHGIFQGGSSMKIFTSLAAVRAGLVKPYPPTACPSMVLPTFMCAHHDGQAPAYNGGWYKSIHDHPEDDIHGTVDLTYGLQVSCNIYFGQLGVALGPDPLKQLKKDGLEIGWGATYEPGKPRSRELALTAFGQGSALISVLQSARMLATVASGGIYRKCPNSMALDATCEERQILPDPNMAVPILSGLSKVAEAGTGARLPKPPNTRVYGKTGTADSIGIKDEAPFGVQVGTFGAPHSWYVSIAEAAGYAPCSPTQKGRIAVSVVVPRGGKGAIAAGGANAEILLAAQSLGYIKGPPGPAVRPEDGQIESAPGPAGVGSTPTPGQVGRNLPAPVPPPLEAPAPSPSPQPSPAGRGGAASRRPVTR